jgi:hypothetical protein
MRVRTSYSSGKNVRSSARRRKSPLHHLEVAEPPRLEVVLEVDQLLAGLVHAPVLLGGRVDGREGVDQLGVQPVGLRPVARQQRRRDGVPPPSQVSEVLVVQARLLQQGLELGLGGRVVGEHLDHVGVLVAEQELDLTVLRRLEAGRRGQERPDQCVLRRRHRRQHGPLVGQHVLDVLDPGEPLERGREVVATEQVTRRAQLVHHQLQPQLGRLVLDDEEQLVVLGRRALRLLGREQEVEPQVVAVGHLRAEVAFDAGFQRADVLGDFVLGALLHPAKVVG